MQWSCPHCGTTLALSDQQMSSGWSFSKCFKCTGFALVRKAEINVIKVDKAPPGENILLPEARETASIAMMSEKEAKKLEDVLWKKNIKEAEALFAPITPDVLNGFTKQEKKKNVFATRLLTTSLAVFVCGFYFYMETEDYWKKPKKNNSVLEKKSAAAQHRSKYLFKVTPRSALSEIRSGPSKEYPVILKTEKNNPFFVSEWKDQWFNLISPETHQSIGWIENEHVKTEPF
jgi:hypothetical protein